MRLGPSTRWQASERCGTLAGPARESQEPRAAPPRGVTPFGPSLGCRAWRHPRGRTNSPPGVLLRSVCPAWRSGFLPACVQDGVRAVALSEARSAVADQGGPWGRPSHSPTLCFRSPWGGGAAPRGSLARLPQSQEVSAPSRAPVFAGLGAGPFRDRWVFLPSVA